jgi:hypothetical protein
MIDEKVYEVEHQADITSDVRGTILRRLNDAFNFHERNSFTSVTLSNDRLVLNIQISGNMRLLCVDTLSNSACTTSIRTQLRST